MSLELTTFCCKKIKGHRHLKKIFFEVDLHFLNYWKYRTSSEPLIPSFVLKNSTQQCDELVFYLSEARFLKFQIVWGFFFFSN